MGEAEMAIKRFLYYKFEIPILKDYTKDDLGEDNCGKWSSNPYKAGRGSRMDHIAVQSIADNVGYKKHDKVRNIVNNLKNGASLGIQGVGWWSSEGPINVSVKIFGDRVADSLASGIKEGFLYSPIRGSSRSHQ